MKRAAVGGTGGGGASDRHVFDLFSGDVVAMRDNCNDDFEHAVLPAQGDQNARAADLVGVQARARRARREEGPASRGRGGARGGGGRRALEAETSGAWPIG